ncbi:MAG TPA: hypothetical protein VE710_18055 [Candidatus Bathyarchaeia archaeon]|nr:hypothetical protein [Candidatus Bathyarchaeia archaeon]
MKNLTKFYIEKPAYEFETFVDPLNIGNYWFSSSSERWEQGKIVTLKYEEYQAELKIEILQEDENEKIMFR